MRPGSLFSGAGLPVAAQGGGVGEQARGGRARRDEGRGEVLCAGVGGGNAADHGGNGDDNAALAGTDGTQEADMEHRQEHQQ